MARHIGRLSNAAAIIAAAFFVSAGCTAAQEPDKPLQMTMGDGESNAIQIEGLVRESGQKTFSDVRNHGSDVSTYRTNSTGITFPKVVIENPGWIVLHPVIDRKPNGDIVSGFTYLNAGENANVTVQMFHPADAGEKYLVMLHNDVDEDRIFDFVFVEDGINVEDRAVFEGNRMIAHFISLP